MRNSILIGVMGLTLCAVVAFKLSDPLNRTSVICDDGCTLNI